MTTVRDLINLYEKDELICSSTEFVFWNGTERVELVVEGIDYAAGKSGMIVLSAKKNLVDARRKELDEANAEYARSDKNLAQVLDERMNEHDQEAETP